MDRFVEGLGPPDLSLCGFALWVHGGLPSPNAWEAWMRVTAHCGGEGASVWVSGELLLYQEVEAFLREAAALHQSLSSVARLSPLEPNLAIVMEMDRRGRLEMTVEITPDPAAQSHRFTFQADQSYLPAFLRQGHALRRRLDPENRRTSKA